MRSRCGRDAVEMRSRCGVPAGMEAEIVLLERVAQNLKRRGQAERAHDGGQRPNARSEHEDLQVWRFPELRQTREPMLRRGGGAAPVRVETAGRGLPVVTCRYLPLPAVTDRWGADTASAQPAGGYGSASGARGGVGGGGSLRSCGSDTGHAPRGSLVVTYRYTLLHTGHAPRGSLVVTHRYTPLHTVAHRPRTERKPRRTERCRRAALKP